MESPDNEKAVFTLKEVKFKDILYIKELAIKEKKTTAIVGKSGSGKTTLLKLLNKLISSDSGIIYYRDTPLEGYRCGNPPPRSSYDAPNTGDF